VYPPASTSGDGFGGGSSASGLVYLRARWYDPEHRTFLQRDPFPGIAALPSTLHPYQYALNNPRMYTDPSGQIPPLVIAALIMGAAAVGGGADVGMQLYEHRAHGWGAWQRVNWGRAGMVAAASGAGAVVGTVAAPVLGTSTVVGTAGGFILAEAAAGATEQVTLNALQGAPSYKGMYHSNRISESG
jgi:RHS repeat-associated protein